VFIGQSSLLLGFCGVSRICLLVGAGHGCLKGWIAGLPALHFLRIRGWILGAAKLALCRYRCGCHTSAHFQWLATLENLFRLGREDWHRATRHSKLWFAIPYWVCACCSSACWGLPNMLVVWIERHVFLLDVCQVLVLLQYLHGVRAHVCLL